MSKNPVCIDREKVLGQLRLHHHDMEVAAGSIIGQTIRISDALGWVKGCISIVERSFRVSHDEGTCVWTHLGDEGGLVRYESSCGMVEFFVESVKGMEAKHCIRCGCKIVEAEE